MSFTAPERTDMVPRMRSSLPAVDYDSFFVAVAEALKLYMDGERIPEKDRPLLVHEFPKTRNGEFDKSFEVILFRIVESTPAGTDPNGRDRKPKGPWLREVTSHPSKLHYQQVTFGWWENVIVEFTILAKSNRRASQLTLWFHRFMMRYAFGYKFFRARGVEDFRFVSRGEDTYNKSYGQELFERSLRYQARLEFLDVFDAKTLEVLEITANEQPLGALDIRS